MVWSITTITLSILAVCFGSLVQSVTGLGAGLIIVPLLALISYDLIPGPIIFASLALTTVMAYRGRHEIKYSNLKLVITGILAGSIIASICLSVIPVTKIGLTFGVLILIAVLLSIKAPEIKFSYKTLLGIGALSGFMGTSVGIGGPVLALLYQHQNGPVIRATLAFLFFISSIIMLVALHFVGRFSLDELLSGIILIPGFIIGYILSPRLIKYIDKGFVRPAVLFISTASALLLIAKSI